MKYVSPVVMSIGLSYAVASAQVPAPSSEPAPVSASTILPSAPPSQLPIIPPAPSSGEVIDFEPVQVRSLPDPALSQPAPTSTAPPSAIPTPSTIPIHAPTVKQETLLQPTRLEETLESEAPYDFLQHTQLQRPTSLFFGLTSQSDGDQLGRLSLLTQKGGVAALEYQRIPESIAGNPDDQIRAGFRTVSFGPVALEAFGATTTNSQGDNEVGAQLLLEPYVNTMVGPGILYVAGEKLALLETRYIGHKLGGVVGDIQLIGNKDTQLTRGFVGWMSKQFYVSAGIVGEGNYVSSQGWLVDSDVSLDKDTKRATPQFGILNQVYHYDNGPEGFHVRVSPSLTLTTLDAFNYDVRSTHVGDFAPIQQWQRPYADFVNGRWGVELSAQRDETADSANAQAMFWKKMPAVQHLDSPRPALQFWGVGAERSRDQDCTQYWGIFDMGASYGIFSAESRSSFDLETNEFRTMLWFGTTHQFER
ncbi:hypothetical protein HYV86_01195 [Candidatus Woesearchaeota archaeon]|nr:hypothetical protein [Candidatus Woesearchaeota archaeon]